MPTIKTKKEMNLAELIEWAIKKDIKDEKFYSKNGCHISIDFRGHVFLWDIRLNEIFTVEIEEPITEDTVIPKLLVKFKSPSRYQVFSNDCINGFEVEEGNIEAFYLINDDKTLTLLWKDGEMIEGEM